MHSEKLETSFLLIVLAGALVLAFLIFEPFLVPLVLGAAFAVALQPLFRSILSHMPSFRGVAAALTMLLFLVCLLTPLALLSMQVVGEAQSLYQSMAGGSGTQNLYAAMGALENTIRVHVPGLQNFTTDLPMTADGYVRGALTWLTSHLFVAFSSVTAIFFDILVFLFALFFFLKDGEEITAALMRLSPLKDEDDRAIFKRLEMSINSIFRGNLLVSLMHGSQMGIGFSLFGVPNPVLWGAVAAFAALIPSGVTFVLVPAVVFLYIFGPLPAAIGLLIWGSIAIALIDNVIGPRLVAHGAQLHQLMVLLAVVGGIAFFGPLGVFLGPLAISFLFAVLAIYGKAPKTA